MNNGKLIDTIGLLDDEMIFEAKFGNKRKYPKVKRNIAAVIAMIIIPISLIFSGFYIFGHIEAGIGSEDPAYRFSYDEKKLLMICRLSLNKKPAKSTNGEYNPKELYEHVGAGIFGVEYADDEKVVVTTGKGIFIYNYKLEYMINNFDLDKIGVPGFNQGDSSSSIRVDISGEYCVMDSCDEWTTSDRVVEYRIISFKNGEIRKISEEEIPESFTPFQTEEINLFSKENKSLPFGRPGEIAASYTKPDGEKLLFYTNIECNNGEIETSGTKALVGNTELVIVSPDKSFTTQRIFASMFEEFQK